MAQSQADFYQPKIAATHGYFESKNIDLQYTSYTTVLRLIL